MHRFRHLLHGLLTTLAVCAAGILAGQSTHPHGRAIRFPDLAELQTLVCDFHQHTVFSDGSVWPDIRVQEAILDSVDAVSMTEHLEYQPHAADLPHADRNRSYEIANTLARPHDILVVNGAEITRNMPPGHCNAIFIEDANQLLIEDSIEVFREALRQEAFVFWNHPNWLGQNRDGIARLSETQLYLINEGLLHGIEVINDLTYSEEALQIALDHDLTILGTSDIHGLVDWQFNIAEGGHRPITLVFAEKRSEEAIRAALFQGRTVAYFNHTLVGREEWMTPLLNACIQVVEAGYQGPSSVAEVVIENKSGAEFMLLHDSAYSLHEDNDLIRLAPYERKTVLVKTREVTPSFELTFTVLNAVTAPKTFAQLRWTIEP